MSADDASNALSLWGEIRRRRVLRVAASYLVAGWMLVEASLAVFGEFDAPAWANRAVILLVVAGFPVTVVLAWLLEFTPQGFRLTSRVRRDDGDAGLDFQRRRNRVAILAGGLLPALLAGAVIGAALIWLLLVPKVPEGDATVGAAGTSVSPADAGGRATPPVVAVLPLSNLSSIDENAYFADGVHEEILTNLSRIEGLRVISRTSVMGYAGTTDNVRDIGAELGATHLVEGSVRRAGDRVRVTAQLIEAASDAHLWAENFDRQLEDIFAVQSDIARQIATALGVRLAGTEDAGELGTRNIDAYDRFVEAQALANSPLQSLNPDTFDRMLDLLHQAVAIDPGFVKAWVLLAELESRWTFQSHGEDVEHLAEARAAVAEVQRRAPGTPDALLAEAWILYYGDGEFQAALDNVERAQAMTPNSAELITLEAYLLRRLGRFEESLAAFSRVLELDPRNAMLINQALILMQQLGRYEDAYRLGRRMAELAPESPEAALELEALALDVRPDFERRVDLMNRILERVRRDEPLPAYRPDWRFLLLLGRRDDALALFQAERRDDNETTTAVYEYHDALTAEFRGERAHAVAMAERALERVLDVETRDPSTRGRPIHPIIKGRIGAYLGLPEVAAEGSRTIRTVVDTTDDALERLDYNFFLVEVLTGIDPDEAARLFLAQLDTDHAPVDPLEFIRTVHLWFPLLENPDVRAVFDSRPEHVAYMRALWPDSRPFPFDD